MASIFAKIFAIIAMIGIGFGLYRTGKLDDRARKDLTTLMLTVTAPCLSLYTLYSKEISKETLVSSAEAFFGCICYVIFASVIAWIAVKVLKASKEDMGCYMVLMVALNNGFMGFPVTKAIFGQDVLYLVVIHNVFMNIYYYSGAIMQFNSGKGLTLRETAKSLASPVTAFIGLGIIMLVFGIQPPQALDDLIRTLGDSTIPISMIVVGLQLGKSDLKGILKNKTLMIASLISMVVIPALVFLIVDPLPLYTDAKTAIIFSSAFPSAVITAALAEQYGKNGKLMAEGVTTTTLMSMITIPIMSMILMAHYY